MQPIIICLPLLFDMANYTEHWDNIISKGGVGTGAINRSCVCFRGKQANHILDCGIALSGFNRPLITGSVLAIY